MARGERYGAGDFPQAALRHSCPSTTRDRDTGDVVAPRGMAGNKKADPARRAEKQSGPSILRTAWLYGGRRDRHEIHDATRTASALLTVSSYIETSHSMIATRWPSLQWAIASSTMTTSNPRCAASAAVRPTQPSMKAPAKTSLSTLRARSSSSKFVPRKTLFAVLR